MTCLHSLVFLVAILSLLFGRCLGQTRVVVNASASHPIPKTLWGQMYEDISSGDGGLYAELLQNRAFQLVTPGTAAALNAWKAVNGATISVIKETVPVSTALPNALTLSVPSGRTGAVGVSNSGYFGIKVDSTWTYSASFFYRFATASNFNGNITAALQPASGSRTFGSASIAVRGSQTQWTQVNLKITPTKSAMDTNNIFMVTLDGKEAAGVTIHLAMFSLFPPTWKNRPNGMRIDIAETLAAMKPSFFRLPGGNNLGETIPTRWQWNATVGPLVSRPGRMGDWSYVNTDGLGLLEYLEFCEDLGVEAILGVWAGYSLGSGGTSVAQSQLGPYIQQVIDELNFVVGVAAESDAAALRASLGHAEPFPLTYVEIGNEDFIGSAPTTYQYRWTAFVTALKAEFPNLKFIATSMTSGPVLTPAPTQYDVHVYQTPTYFRQHSFDYDSFERNGTTYFEGEYAAISTNSSDVFGTPATGRLLFPTMQGAAGEASFMTGLERNSDIVFAAAYAPLLGHVNASQWTPNLVGFDAGKVIKSTSFYTQQLFSLNRGDEYIPSTLPSPGGSLFWSVVRNTTTRALIIKVVNNAPSPTDITFQFPPSFNITPSPGSTGNVQVLTGPATASNTPTVPDLIVPEEGSVVVSEAGMVRYAVPGVSVSVITVGGGV